MISGTLARVVPHHRRHRDRSGLHAVLATEHVATRDRMRRAIRARSSYRAFNPVTLPGCTVPLATSNRTAPPVVFVLLALTTESGQAAALSARHVQAIDIVDVYENVCPRPCLGERKKALWTFTG